MTALRIVVDEDLCIGSGDCVTVAPEAFHLGPNDLTVTVLEAGHATDPEVLRAAEMQCPTGAIRIGRLPDG